MQTAKENQLADIDGVGEIIAKSIKEWFSIDWHKSIIKKWEKAGVKMIEIAQISTKPQTLADLTLVVTGSLVDFTRDGVNDVILEHGGKSTSSVSKNTDFVIVGESPGSKLAKAEELGIPVLNESQFKKLLANGPDGLR